MPSIRVTQNTKARPPAVWDLLSDFGNIDFFNPNLSRSYLLAETGEIGLGSTRQCDMTDGKNYIREKIIDWQQGKSYTVDIYEGTMPLDRSQAKIGILPSASGGSLVYMEFEYEPSFGLMGKMMNAVMMKRMMTGMLQKTVDGLAQKAELASAPATNVA